MADKKGAKAQGEAPATGNSDGATFLKKITGKDVMGDKIAKFVPKRGEKAVPLFVVYGIANGTKSGETNLGPWTALTGVFEAHRISDGERFTSAVCFLPGAASDMAIATLRANKEKDADSSISFGVEVSVKYMERKDGTDGFEYVTRDTVKAQQADLLQELRGKALIGFDGK